MQNIKIAAGIVLYNPEINRLKDNISHIINQVEVVLLVNNGSFNSEDIIKLSKKYMNCIYIDLKENRGIAAALNAIVSFAKRRGFKWVLTLDQDTVCNADIVKNYSRYIGLDKIGQLTCIYKDRNFNNVDYDFNGLVKEVNWCITSAALVSVNAWETVNGADEALFIDGVDFDICLSMREAGYKIYQCAFVGFTHEIGRGKTIHLGPFKIKTWNHSAIRRYYSARNAIIVAKKHKSLNVLKTFCGTVKHIITILVFENNKRNKLVSGVKGLIDGLKWRCNS